MYENQHHPPAGDLFSLAEAQRRAEKEASAETCPHCMQIIKKLNPHHMDYSKVKMLADIAELNKSGFRWVKIQQDQTLIPKDGPEQARTLQRDAVHASRLKWFGLLDLKKRRSGEYRVNRRGYMFLLGKESVPEVIYCRAGKVVTESETNVFLRDIKSVILDKAYWDNYPTLQTALETIKA